MNIKLVCRNLFLQMLMIVLLTMPLSATTSAQNIIDLEESDDFVQNTDTETPLTELEEEDLFINERPADINDNAKIRLEFIQEVQNPQNKEVVFNVRVFANVASDRIKISWELKGFSTLKNPSATTTTITLLPGESATIPIALTPAGYGVSEIKVVAELFEANSRTLAVARKNFAANQAQEILPITSEYQAARQANQIMQVVFLVFAGITIAVVGLFLYTMFLKWYRKD